MYRFPSVSGRTGKWLSIHLPDTSRYLMYPRRRCIGVHGSERRGSVRRGSERRGVRATGSASDRGPSNSAALAQPTRGMSAAGVAHRLRGSRIGCGCRTSAAGVAHRLRVSRIGCERRGGRRATRTWRPAQREGSRLSSSARFERSDEQSNAPSACDRHHTHSPPHACALATARATRRSGRRYNGVRICTRLTCLM